MRLRWAKVEPCVQRIAHLITSLVSIFTLILPDFTTPFSFPSVIPFALVSKNTKTLKTMRSHEKFPKNSCHVALEADLHFRFRVCLLLDAFFFVKHSCSLKINNVISNTSGIRKIML